MIFIQLEYNDVYMHHQVKKDYIKYLHMKWRQASLTHWGRMMLTTIGSDNGFLPSGHQAIIYTSAGILLIRILGTNFIGILSEIQT